MDPRSFFSFFNCEMEHLSTFSDVGAMADVRPLQMLSSIFFCFHLKEVVNQFSDQPTLLSRSTQTRSVPITDTICGVPAIFGNMKKRATKSHKAQSIAVLKTDIVRSLSSLFRLTLTLTVRRLSVCSVGCDINNLTCLQSLKFVAVAETEPSLNF